jgi:hypothetical protein
MTNISIGELLKPMMPFYIACVLVPSLTTDVPQLALWAPDYFK